MKYPTRDELQQKVKSAIDHLFHRDGDLFTLDVNERSISHKLASYLQEEFGDEWDVDCEYNRDRHEIKYLKSLKGSGEPDVIDDTNAQTVYPDIIVHHRDTDDNALVIEIKKTSNAQGKNFDMKKLRAFKRELDYEHTLYLQLRTESDGRVDKEIWDDNDE